jgi:hypothetical protein
VFKLGIEYKDTGQIVGEEVLLIRKGHSGEKTQLDKDVKVFE